MEALRHHKIRIKVLKSPLQIVIFARTPIGMFCTGADSYLIGIKCCFVPNLIFADIFGEFVAWINHHSKDHIFSVLQCKAPSHHLHQGVPMANSQAHIENLVMNFN